MRSHLDDLQEYNLLLLLLLFVSSINLSIRGSSGLFFNPPSIHRIDLFRLFSHWFTISPLTHSFIHSFIHSSIHSSTLLFIQSFQCNKSTAAFKSSRAAHHLGIRRGPICSDHISVSPVTSTFTIAQVDLHPGDNSAITTFESKLFHSYKIGAGKLGCWEREEGAKMREQIYE